MNRRTIAAAALATLFAASAATASYRGETYVCQFPKAGRVVIDTREPGATVQWRGHSYPVSGGSYFYNTEDGRVVVYFGPAMKWWNFGDGKDRAICPHRKNSN